MAVARPRRTQEQRRSETRGRLLDATIASLLDAGYAATTTRRVAELAGVSMGAQTHHFPYRVDLVGAAVERLAEQRIAEMSARADSLPSGREERVRAVLEMLWGDFSSDLFRIFVKLWVAAADDPELYARLVPLERRMTRVIASALPGFVGDGEVPEDLAARATVVLAALRGLALTRAYEPVGRRPKDPWASVAPVLERLVLAE